MADQQLFHVPAERIRPNPFQPRQRITQGELEELTSSIREHGVLQPLLLRSKGDWYELVAGERRWRACLSLGLATVPAIVREMSDGESAILALVENIQREELDYMEEAEGIRRLLAEFSLTQEEVAKKMGKSQSAVANKLRLLRLPPRVRDGLREAGATERHARALLKLTDQEAQERVVAEIAAKGLTVAETERLVESREQEPAGGSRPKGKRQGVYRDLRIFLNSFKQVVRTLVQSGIRAKLTEIDRGDYLEISVHIPKEKQAN